MITLSKIAKEAHVSVSTASKAFSGSPEVNDQTREDIFAVARKYGCFQKFFNAKYSKFVIAIICPEFGSSYYARHLSFLQQYLEEEGCEICVAASNFSAEREHELLDYYYKHAAADGILVVQPQGTLGNNLEIPVLAVSSRAALPDCPSISCSLDAAMGQALLYLKEKGVSSVGFIGEKLSKKKLALFKKTTEEQKIPVSDEHIVISAGRFEEGGYEAMNSLLSCQSIPRAVVCAYDYMAIGAIKCLHDKGLKVPEDVAVLGMDDIPQCPFLTPPLSSLTQRTEETCRLAAKTILQMIGGQEVPLRQNLISKFQLRRSFEFACGPKKI